MVKRDSNFNPVNGSRGIRNGSSAPADWASANATIIRDAILAAANVGGALRFGYSRDGGAYALGIYGDGPPYTEFIRPSEDINVMLTNTIQLFENIADDNARKDKAPKG